MDVLHAHLVWDADGNGRFGRDVTTPWVQATYDALEQLLCVVSPVWTHVDLFREAVTHARILSTPLLRNRLNEIRPGLAMLRRFYVGKFPSMDNDPPVSPDEPCNEIYLPPLSTGNIYRCRTYSHSCVAGAVLAIEQVSESLRPVKPQVAASEAIHVSFPASTDVELLLGSNRSERETMETLLASSPDEASDLEATLPGEDTVLTCDEPMPEEEPVVSRPPRPDTPLHRTRLRSASPSVPLVTPAPLSASVATAGADVPYDPSNLVGNSYV